MTPRQVFVIHIGMLMPVGVVKVTNLLYLWAIYDVIPIWWVLPLTYTSSQSFTMVTDVISSCAMTPDSNNAIVIAHMHQPNILVISCIDIVHSTLTCSHIPYAKLTSESYSTNWLHHRLNTLSHLIFTFQLLSCHWNNLYIKYILT